MRNATENVDNVDKTVDNVDESVYIVENNVDNVEEMVDNVEIAAADGTTSNSFGKNALVALVLVCIGLLLYMTYKRWKQYKVESVLSN